MNRKEAMKILVEGGRVTRADWPQGWYLHMPSTDVLIYPSGAKGHNDLVTYAEGWKRYEDVKLALSPNDLGKKVRLRNGMTTLIIQTDRDHDTVVKTPAGWHFSDGINEEGYPHLDIMEVLG